jgi:hypothetical protein
MTAAGPMTINDGRRHYLYCRTEQPYDMYQRDYILRLVAMLGDLIAGIMSLIKKGDLQQASEKLDKLYPGMLREDAAFFRKLPEEGMTDTLLRKHNYTNGHLEILAELFNTEAELLIAGGDRTGSMEFSRKALALFEFIDKEYKTYSQERIDKMEIIRQRLSE